MNAVVCAYRDWALEVVPTIASHPRVSKTTHVTDNKQLESFLVKNRDEVDVVLFVGWSTPPQKWLVELGIPMVSEHPATSDRYSPGTPLQNQILDGLTKTKHRIVKVGYPELSPRQWSHEVDMDLIGNMSDILKQMSETSKVLFREFLNEFPTVTWKTWAMLPESAQVPRRTPQQSELSRNDLLKLTTRQLYDKIRCLEDPYPNAFVEDEHGTLYIQRVSYVPKK